MQRLAISASAALLSVLAAGQPSRAAESVRGDGATLSLVAAPVGSDGTVRAALRVELEPGWKTYWLDPGDAGIPPGLDFTRSTGLRDPETHFPAPVRFQDDAQSSSIGYLEPFAIAIEGKAGPSEPGILDVQVTLGLCRELCVPVAAELTLDLAKAKDAEAVTAAFAALPHPSGPEAGITNLRLSPDATELRVGLRPASLAEGADLFVAAPGWVFGEPTGTEDGGMALPVLRKPRKPGAPLAAEAVLVAKDGSFRASATIAAGGG